MFDLICFLCFFNKGGGDVFGDVFWILIFGGLRRLNCDDCWLSGCVGGCGSNLVCCLLFGGLVVFVIEMNCGKGLIWCFLFCVDGVWLWFCWKIWGLWDLFLVLVLEFDEEVVEYWLLLVFFC